jgi:hypothetical protein
MRFALPYVFAADIASMADVKAGFAVELAHALRAANATLAGGELFYQHACHTTVAGGWEHVLPHVLPH